MSDLSAGLQRTGAPAPIALEAPTYLSTTSTRQEQTGMASESARQIADWHAGTWSAVRWAEHD
eukprot:3519904-Pyramimonas_sp.AAC.1